MAREFDQASSLGEKTAFTVTFDEAMQLLTAEQLTSLLDSVSARLTATESVSANNPSSLLSGIEKGLKIIKFRVQQRLDIVETGSQAPPEAFNMVCIQCNIPVPESVGGFICLMCGSYEWVELDRVQPPSE